MKKSLKKFALITVSALTLAAVAPVASMYAQDGDTDDVVEETMSEDEDSLEMDDSDDITDPADLEEAEPSELQVALEDIIAAFEADYPEVGMTQVTVEPLDEMDDDVEGDLSPSADIPEVDELEGTEDEEDLGLTDSAGDLEGSDLETDLDLEESDTMDDDLTEEDPLADEEVEEAFEITIEGEDMETEEMISVSYDSTTGEELPESELDDLGLEEEVNVSEDENAILEDTLDNLEEAGDDQLDDTEDDLVADTENPMMEETTYLAFDEYAEFDDVKETAELEVPFGQAREFVLSIDETTDQAEWEVTIHENIEFPEEGREATVTLDAVTLEVLSVEGDVDMAEETIIEEEVVPVTEEEEYVEELPEEETDELEETDEEETDEEDGTTVEDENDDTDPNDEETSIEEEITDEGGDN